VGNHPDLHRRDIGNDPYFQTFKMMEIEDMMQLSTHRKSLFTNKNGFTLIELAMVMVIVGLLLTIGMNLVGPLTKRAKLIEARETVKAAKESVLGYGVKNGYLPLSTNPDPLGLAGARRLDAWGRNLLYGVTSGLTTSLDGPGNNACGRTATNRTVFECTNPACTTANTKSNVAFIVYSIGDDANGAATTTQPGGGPACPALQTCYWIREQGSTYTVGPTTYQYDDIVQYATLDEIRTGMGCSQPLAITSPATLPQGEEDSFYTYTLQATGGRPPYTWGPLWSVFGLSMNPPAPGLISGTINANALTSTGELAACAANITPPAPGTVTVTDSAGATATLAINIPVRPKPLSITNTEMPTTTTAFTGAYATLNGAGGRYNLPASPYNWTLAGNPAWLTVGLSTGILTVNPAPGGLPRTQTFTATLTDLCGNTTSKVFTITIN